MERVLQEEGNFIGLVDPEGVTLQFLVNDDRSIRIDIPIPIQKGSYTKTGNLAECQQLVDSLGEEVDYESLPDLAFEEWG